MHFPVENQGLHIFIARGRLQASSRLTSRLWGRKAPAHLEMRLYRPKAGVLYGGILYERSQHHHEEDGGQQGVTRQAGLPAWTGLLTP